MRNSRSTRSSGRPAPWAWTTPAAAALFTGAWLVLPSFNHGYVLFDVRVPSYSPVSQPISGLGLGATAAFMNTAFVLTGVLAAVGIVTDFRALRGDGPEGLRRRARDVLLLFPLGTAVCGVFTLRVMAVHSLGFLIAGASPVVGLWLTGRYLRAAGVAPGLARGLVTVAPAVTALLLAGFFLTFEPTVEGSQSGAAGALQRVLVIDIFGWLCAFSVAARRAARARAGRPGTQTTPGTPTTSVIVQGPPA